MILANTSSKTTYLSGLDSASSILNTDFKIFGKPSTRPYRRMGVALSYGNESTDCLVKKAKEVVKLY